MTDTYNGWTNRETWATALHIDNDEGLYNHRLELCEDAVREVNKGVLPVLKPHHVLADSLKDWIEEMGESLYQPGCPASEDLARMFSDIGSVWRVNWDEIARNFLEDYK